MQHAHGNHDWLFFVVKDAVVAGPRSGRIDLISIADANRVSITPVREIMFRLIGEGLVVGSTGGGFERSVPDAAGLSQLYAWNAEHVLAAAHLIPEVLLKRTLDGMVGIPASGQSAAQRDGAARLFLAIAHATGNDEFRLRTAHANERLVAARRVEQELFPDSSAELETLLRTRHHDARAGFRRRVRAYHRRRVEASGTIAAMLAAPHGAGSDVGN